MSEQDGYLIAYCGLGCAGCFGYKMAVSEAAKQLRRELRTAKLKGAWHEFHFWGSMNHLKKRLMV